jgi:thymidylate kinase
MMDSIRKVTDQEDQAWNAFLECSSALEKDNLAVELRSRARDEETAYSGDYDYLMDPSRFEEIVRLVFRVCVEHGVSFQVQQRAAFKRRIILFGSDRRTIMFEFWPHAELTTDTHARGWAFLTHQRFSEACEAGLKEETLALLYVCHLFFKNKDLSSAQNQWRLEDFASRMSCIVEAGGEHASFAAEIRLLLTGIIQEKFTLSEANGMALNLLAKNNIQVEGCGAAKWSQLCAKAKGPFRGWGGRVVPCVGPDGSGKTYFITTVMDWVNEHSLNAESTRFKRLFRKNKIYAYISKRYRTPRDLPKNIADERLAPLLYWVALPAYWWGILKSLNKKAVFMDRFFLEFMVRGYRENEGQGIRQISGYSLLCRMIPEPRRMIVLTADDELISSRKADLSSEAIQDFYSRYISFSVNREISNVLFLNSHRPGPELAECCLNSIGILKKIKP